MPLRVRVWGTRGSIPTPGARTVRYGGNTPCLEVRTPTGWLVILDAGTGIRTLGGTLLGYWIARFGLGPVRRLSRQANSLPPGDSKQRLDTEALPGELQELAVSFNGALARQEAARRKDTESWGSWAALANAARETLRIGDTIAAVYYGLLHNGHAYGYLTGLDPDFAHESPGTLIIAHAMEQAVREGVLRGFYLAKEGRRDVTMFGLLRPNA